MSVITVVDLASYLQDQTIIDMSNQLVVDLANGLVEDVLDGDLTPPYPARVTAITLEVAARSFRNPNGYSSETIDDYTYRRDPETRRAGVYLTGAETSELRRIATPAATGGRAFSLSGLDPEWYP